MRIMFIGCVESSKILLKELLDHNFKVVGVITKKSSKINADFVDLTEISNHHNVESRYWQKSSDDDAIINFIQNKKPDWIYCFGWSHLLKKNVLNLPKQGVLGFHPSKLPYNKGRHPIIWSLVLGLSQTASTFFIMDEKPDNGEIVSQENVQIAQEDDARSLYNKIMDTAKNQVLSVTQDIKTDSLVKVNQREDVGNTWRKRTKLDGKIDFRMSTQSIYNLIRALTKPYIGAHFNHMDKEYKVWSADFYYQSTEDFRNIEPGKVIEVYSNKSFLVKTGDGVIAIKDCDENNLKKGDYL